jgi:ribosome-associated translation inhibitor RaiA
MEPKLQISVTHLARNAQLPRIVNHIERRLSRLSRRRPDLARCSVTVSLPHRRHRKHNDYQVLVDLVTRRTEAHATSHGHRLDGSDVCTCIKRAFKAAETQLSRTRRAP